MERKKLPIGYYIKQVDELLTKGIDEIQNEFGLSRKGWQVLNTVFQKDEISRTNLQSLMNPFADLEALNFIVAELQERQLVIEKEEQLTLTIKGIELHKSCLQKQQAFRQKAMANISELQYETTLTTLQKMIENLQSKP